MPDQVSETLKLAIADAEAANQSAVNLAAVIRKTGEQIVRFAGWLAASSADAIGAVLGIGVATSAAILSAPHLALFSLSAIPFIGVSGGALGVIGARLTKTKETPHETKRLELDLIEDAVTRGLLTKEDAQERTRQIFLGELAASAKQNQLTSGTQTQVSTASPTTELH